jgi:2,5-furandicarboxylate decarboxylase 1
MSLRDLLQKIGTSGQGVLFSSPVSKTFEIAGILKKLEPEPVLFNQVTESSFRVAGNLFCSKAAFANYLGISVEEIIPSLIRAIDQHTPSEITQDAPCQEVIIDDPDLNDLPILRHCEKDGGNYISSGIFITRHPIYGQNVDFHRCMQFSQTEMAVRVVRSRHFDQYLRDLKQIDVAICIGNAPHVLAAAATSVEKGVNELEIANALQSFKVVKARTLDVFIPAETEFVIEGTVYLDITHPEGPFVDLTETYDIIRQEPVFVVKTITHRKDAIWHALLPGALEHKLLMGMPREPTIFRKVNEVVRCLDVNVNPGGCSWLHAIVQIDKQAEDDGKKAIEAAFAGHTSCKHVYIVDRDIDIYDPQQVEWAMATRFQGDRDLIIRNKEPGSSLDPSAETGTHLTTKMGFDLTKPIISHGKSFERAPFPQVDLSRYLKP